MKPLSLSHDGTSDVLEVLRKGSMLKILPAKYVAWRFRERHVKPIPLFGGIQIVFVLKKLITKSKFLVLGR